RPPQRWHRPPPRPQPPPPALLNPPPRRNTTSNTLATKPSHAVPIIKRRRFVLFTWGSSLDAPASLCIDFGPCPPGQRLGRGGARLVGRRLVLSEGNRLRPFAQGCRHRRRRDRCPGAHPSEPG